MGNESKRKQIYGEVEGILGISSDDCLSGGGGAIRAALVMMITPNHHEREGVGGGCCKHNRSDSIPYLSVSPLSLYHVVVPREDAMGASTPRLPPHRYHGAWGVNQLKFALTVMKGANGATMQAQRVNHFIKDG